MSTQSSRRAPRVLASLATVVIVLCVYLLPSHAQPDSPTCELWKVLRNRNRFATGPLSAECHGDVINCLPFFGHSVPFGNWGVDSNLNARVNTDQFAGWKPIDGQLQWNSCVFSFSPPNCTYFNTPDCSNQVTEAGEIPYAFALVNRWLNFSCDMLVFLDGMVVTSTGNFMDIWELDGCDEDEHVAYVALPDLDAVMSCDPGGHFCQGFGAWLTPLDVSPNVLTTEVQLVAEAYEVWP